MPPDAPDTTEPGKSRRRALTDRGSALFLVANAAAVLMVLGGFGPWATAAHRGTALGASGLGWFLIIGGFVAATLLWHPMKSRLRHAAIITVIALAGTAVSVVSLADVQSLIAHPGGPVSPVWGLYVALGSSVVLLAAGALAVAMQLLRPAAG